MRTKASVVSATTALRGPYASASGSRSRPTIHTIAPPAMRQIIAMASVGPTHPWDAVICTSPSVHASLSQMFEGWEDYLAERTGYRVGSETVRKRLHRADYVCKRPTWTLKRKAEEQPEWAKNA